MIPPSDPLIASMPSGRDLHTNKPFNPPRLDEETLARMKAPPKSGLVQEGLLENDSSDDEAALSQKVALPGEFPDTSVHGSDQYY